MSVGLSGAQRVGKSTLAQAYADRLKVPFLQTSASATFVRLGFDPKADYDFLTRLRIQKEILFDCAKLYRSAPARFITDRTPIDFMAYLLADVQRQNVQGEAIDELADYIAECYRIANAHFSAIVLLRPGIPLVDEPGKAPANSAHMAHIDALCTGLLYDGRYEGSRFYIPRGVLTIEERIKCVKFAEDATAERQLAFLGLERETRGELAVH